MNSAKQRFIARWVHIACSIPIIGYIYSPFEQIPNYAPATRYVFFPVMLLSGLWMWKGHALRSLVSKRSARDHGRFGAHSSEGEFSFGRRESRS